MALWWNLQVEVAAAGSWKRWIFLSVDIEVAFLCENLQVELVAAGSWQWWRLLVVSSTQEDVRLVNLLLINRKLLHSDKWNICIRSERCVFLHMSNLLVPAAWTLAPGTACPACRASPAAAVVVVTQVDRKVKLQQQHTHAHVTVRLCRCSHSNR